MKILNSILVLISGLALAILFSNLPWAKALDLYGYDFLLSHTMAPKASGSVAVVGIDEAALKRFEEPLVLWHKYLSEVILAVSRGGARSAALDIIPAISLETLAPELDRRLILSMRQADKQGTPVFLGFTVGRDGQMPHRKFVFSASGLGFLNLWPDEDGKIRRQRLFLGTPGSDQVFSMPLLAVENGSGISSEKYPPLMYIDFRQSPPPVHSFGQVYDWAVSGNTGKLKEAFENKIVFIGATSAKLQDIHRIPIKINSGDRKYTPGVIIHAFTAKTILAGNFLREIPFWVVWSFAVFLGIASGLLYLFLPPRRAGAITVLIIIGLVFILYQTFKLSWILPVAPFIFAIIIPAAVCGGFRYVREYRQFRVLQRYFKSYVHPEVMKEIIEKPELVSFAGKNVQATVMFSDIRGFTTLSELMRPEEVVSGLNRYFTEMTSAITNCHGYVNQYLGDGLLAIFGAPNPMADQGALNAVRAALKMLDYLETLNKASLFPGGKEVKIGIGLHTGEAVMGNLGSIEKMAYSIIGDTVNLASRIEGQTKEYGVSLLVSESTHKLVEDSVEARFVDQVQVKGRTQPVKLFEILSLKNIKSETE